MHNTAGLSALVSRWRGAGERIALVPTMGNLHAGHLALVEAAAKQADRIVVSIFVNPGQFGPNEDFDAYPRTLDADLAALQATPCDAVFAPTVSDMYPLGRDDVVLVEVPGLSGILCGEARPTHFRGVATVVTILFNRVVPDVAVFGKKDYQQLRVIETLTRGLGLPVIIVGCDTVRESDGLAMSSRNQYLEAGERQRAPILNQTLRKVSEALMKGERDFAGLEAGAMQALRAQGFEPDYLSVRRAGDLAPPGASDSQLVVLAAARLGKARLIDNIEVGGLRCAAD